MTPLDAAGGPSRRSVLAALGAAAATCGASALAGCSTVPGGDEGPKRVHSSELPAVADDPGLELWATYPIAVPTSHLRGAQAVANDALESVPLPFGERRIPNGHVRGHLVDAAAAARDHLDDAMNAPTQRASLRSLRRARGNARYAAAGWAAVDDGLEAAAVRERRTDVVERARAERESHEYLGADPVQATVVHASLEALFAEAATVDDSTAHDERVRVLRVAGLAENVERASAALADAEVVGERYRRSLPDDASSLESQIAGAGERLASQVREGVGELPSEADATVLPDTDLSETHARHVLGDAYRAADRHDGLPLGGSGPASIVVDAIQALADIGAYETVRDRIETGERFDVDAPAVVVDAYERAHEAVATAPADSSAPGLARAALASTASDVRRTDRILASASGTVDLRNYRQVVSEYAIAAAVADAVPAAVDEAVDALDA